MPAFVPPSPACLCLHKGRLRNRALGALLLGQCVQEPLQEGLALLQGCAEVQRVRVSNLHTQLRKVRCQALAQERRFLCVQCELYHTFPPS